MDELFENEIVDSVLEDDKYVWQDTNGKLYRMEDITDSHMRNIIGLLDRAASAAMSCGFQGEMASYYADQAADGASDRAWEFQAELDRRDRERFS